jgi:hypothetical protein
MPPCSDRKIEKEEVLVWLEEGLLLAGREGREAENNERDMKLHARNDSNKAAGL